MSHINPRYCRDYLHGSCDRLNCRYDHATAAELMEQGEDVGRLIFCRDFQRSNCFRPAGSCRFIHATTQDEQYYRVYKMLPMHLLQNLPSNISMTLLCPIQQSPTAEQYVPGPTLLQPPMLPLPPGVMVTNVSTSALQQSPPPPTASAVAAVATGPGLLPPYSQGKPPAPRHSPILAAAAAPPAVLSVDVSGVAIHHHAQRGVHHYGNAMAHQQVLQVFPGLPPPTTNHNFAATIPTMPRPAMMYGPAGAALPHHRAMTSHHHMHRPITAAIGSSVIYQPPPATSQRPNFLPYHHGYQHIYKPKEGYGHTGDSEYHGYSDLSAQPGIMAVSQTAHFSKSWPSELHTLTSVSQQVCAEPADVAVPILSSSPPSPMATPGPTAVESHMTGEYGKSLEVSSVCEALSLLTLPDPLTDSVERVRCSDHHGDTVASATLESSTEETRA